MFIALARCLLPGSAWADTFSVAIGGVNGNRIPKIIGASGSINNNKAFTGFDYFEWFGITHYRNWFKPSFSPLNPTGGVVTVADFDAATAAVRADPWRQGTANDVYIDWQRFNSDFDTHQRYVLERLRSQGIQSMMVNTVFTSADPLTDWGTKFKYWKFWYAYVYFFASQYDITMYEFRNEPNALGSYEQWQSHWLVCADAMRKAMADVNANYGKNLTLYICGPTLPGEWWNYSLNDPDVDPHGWGSLAWGDIRTDIYGNYNSSIANFGMYDYHKYGSSGADRQTEILNLRQNLSGARNAPNYGAAIPIIISEYNTATSASFESMDLDTEDLTYGTRTAQILQSTATLGADGLGDDGGFFLFKLGASDDKPNLLNNRTAYMSEFGAANYGGISRGGVCFQLYARHFRGGKPVLAHTVTTGSDSQRRLVAAWDDARHAYYIYFSNVNGTDAAAVFDLSSLDVHTGAPVTVARVDSKNTGQITDYLAVDSNKKVSFSAPNLSAFLVWIPQGGTAGQVPVLSPTKDSYLAVGESGTSHGSEATLKVSLHHATPGERRLGFIQFDLGALTNGNRYLLKLCGHNTGVSQSSREILHIYGQPGSSWTEANLTWATAPGVGMYYTTTNTMSPTTGLTTNLTDIEDNYGGVVAGTGLGLYGKFLGPMSFFSSAWATNYVDVTDYVKSQMTSNQASITFVIARIVRYDVNAYSNSTYYHQGVYDCDGRMVEIASRENPAVELQPGLCVFKSAKPSPPMALTATPGAGEVALCWQPSFDATNYRVKRASKSGGPYQVLGASVTDTNYTDAGLLNGSTGYYVVSGLDGELEGDNSTEVAAVAWAPRSPLADAYVRGGTYGTSNYGTDPALMVKVDSADYTRESFLQFDVRGLADMRAVKLRLMPVSVGTDGATTSVAFEWVTNNGWTETGLTWNSKPASSGILFTNLTGFQVGQLCEVDVTQAARAQATNDGVLSVRLYSTVAGSNRSVQFGAREQPSAADRPALAYVPAAPALQVSPAADHFTLSWSGAGFGLFVTTNLVGPAVWSLVTNAVLNQGGTFSLELPGGPGNHFFRLATFIK